MKFLFVLHDDRIDKNIAADRMFYPHVHGPFEDRQKAIAYISSHRPNDKEARFLLVDAEILTSPPSVLEKPESEKRAPGNEANWTKKSKNELDESWTCNTCNAIIQAVQVAHPVHDGPFALSGSGECRYETVGYCPNCERKPSFHGAPVSG